MLPLRCFRSGSSDASVCSDLYVYCSSPVKSTLAGGNAEQVPTNARLIVPCNVCHHAFLNGRDPALAGSALPMIPHSDGALFVTVTAAGQKAGLKPTVSARMGLLTSNGWGFKRSAVDPAIYYCRALARTCMAHEGEYVELLLLEEWFMTLQPTVCVVWAAECSTLP